MNRQKPLTASRRWKLANPDAVRAYYLTDRERYIERSRLQYAADPEKAKKAARNIQKANPERTRAFSRKSWVTNRDKQIKAKRQRYMLNRLEYLEKVHSDRAVKLGRMGTITPGVFTHIWEKQDGFCNNLFCNTDLVFGIPYDIDHIMPYKLGGLHEDSNIQILCRRCSRRKQAKHPDNFFY